MFGRRLHMISTSWGYLFMSAHIGLHFGMIAGMLKKTIKFKNKWFDMAEAISVALISAYGIYAFITRQFVDRMFLLMEYAFFDYEEPALFFFGDYLCILILFVALTFILSKILKQRKRSELK